MKSIIALFFIAFLATSCATSEFEQASTKNLEGRWFLENIVVDDEQESKILTDDWKSVNYEFLSTGEVNIYLGDRFRKTNTWSYNAETGQLNFLDLFNTPFLGTIITLNDKSLVLESTAVIEGTNTAKEAQYYFNK